MAENTVDIKLRADAGDATKNLGAVVAELDALAGKLGGELGTQAKEAAQRLRELGEQRAAIEAFQQISAQAAQTQSALRGLSIEADRYQEQITRAGPPTAQEVEQLNRLRAAADAAKIKMQEQQAAVSQAAAAMQRHGVSVAGAGQAMTRIEAETRRTVEGMTALHAQTAAAVKPLSDAGGTAERTAQSVSALGDAAHRMAAQMATAFTFRELVQAAAQMEQVSAGLKAVFGSAEQAAQGMEFVRGVAARTGTDVADAAKAFLGLSAATKGTAVEGEPTRAVFEAVATSMAKAGKSSAETQNALLALSQMASKGVVQMEELRGQLGEALPGALQAAADGLGITTQDLMKLAEAGQLTASDIFPALAKGLDKLYGSASQAQTLSAEITNVKNAFVEMAANIGEAGGLSALKTAAEVAQAALVNLDVVLVSTGKTIGILAGAVATMNFSRLKEEFAAVQAEAEQKLLKAAQHNDVLRASIEASGNAAQIAALKQQGAGAAAEKAGAQAAGAGEGWVKLASDYTKVLAAMDEQATKAEKAVMARDAEGKAAVALAQALGTEAQQRAAKVQATQADADATATLAQVRFAEVEARKAELAALQKLAADAGKLDEQKKKQLDDLQKDIALRQEVADKAVAQARAARIAAEVAAVEAEAQRDNSGRVKELAAAYDAARKKAEELRASKKASAAEMEAADIAASRAAALYRDALSDVTKNLQARQTIEQATLTATTAALSAEKARYQAMIDAARADGDYATALYATIEQKKLDIEITRAKVAGMRAEADGAIAVAKAQLAELEASQKIDPVKRAQIEASIKIAEAKKLEADAVGRSVDGIERQIQELRDGRAQVEGFGKASQGAADAQQRLGDVAEATGDRASAAALKAASALEAQNAAQERLNAASEKAAELERKRLGVDKEGFSVDKDGKRIVAGGDLTTLTGVFNFLKSAGVTDEAEARRLALEFSDGKGNIPYLQNPGQLRYGGDTLSMALLKAAEQFTFSAAALEKKTGEAAQPASPPPAVMQPTPMQRPSAPAYAPAAPGDGLSSRSVTVHVNVGGERASVRTDEADARRLVQVLQSLSSRSSI
ncbi:tape measure protein [Tibeticola sp.]|uniref:tape measure protein n=1 Tax=Tibeticola sp. TaxID=2005368 RepID=UPI0025EB5A2E|nr:tape measure protein [Tibeticola sp.]